jgi:hypothetical protein
MKDLLYVILIIVIFIAVFFGANIILEIVKALFSGIVEFVFN